MLSYEKSLFEDILEPYFALVKRAGGPDINLSLLKNEALTQMIVGMGAWLRGYRPEDLPLLEQGIYYVLMPPGSAIDCSFIKEYESVIPSSLREAAEAWSSTVFEDARSAAEEIYELVKSSLESGEYEEGLLDYSVPAAVRCYRELGFADSPSLGHAMNSVASCPDFIPKMKEYLVSSLVPYSPFSGWNGFVEVSLLKCADVTPLTKIDVRALSVNLSKWIFNKVNVITQACVESAIKKATHYQDGF
jgi:hypothetical protein